MIKVKKTKTSVAREFEILQDSKGIKKTQNVDKSKLLN